MKNCYLWRIRNHLAKAGPRLYKMQKKKNKIPEYGKKKKGETYDSRKKR